MEAARLRDEVVTIWPSGFFDEANGLDRVLLGDGAPLDRGKNWGMVAATRRDLRKTGFATRGGRVSPWGVVRC